MNKLLSKITKKLMKKFIMISAFAIFFMGLMIVSASQVNHAQTKERDILLQNEMQSVYSDWKQKYVVSMEMMARVVNPQDNYNTVSEGIGYGLLFSVAMEDETTFKELWQYAQKYLDRKGLMHWKINASGQVIGRGSATDADQDIAYALLLADKKWPNQGYLDAAKKMIQAIKKYEVDRKGMLLAGDSWNRGSPINPSYFAPDYYQKFSEVTNDTSWEKVRLVNLQFIQKVADSKTGLVPDWVNQDGSVRRGENDFGYDAIRTPIRLLQFYKSSRNLVVGEILQKEYRFIENIGIDNISAGYTTDGRPLKAFINPAYLAAFTVLSNLEPNSEFSNQLVHRLIATPGTDYYSSSLKVWVLLIGIGAL